MSKKRALFLDRDGVINEDHGYVYKVEDFQFKDGIFELCQRAKSLGYLIIVVTNQSGIGREYYTEDDFLNLTAWMEEKFKEKNIQIDKVYYCPYHQDSGIGKYKQDSPDRKPKPGMLLKAEKEFNIDMSKSLMVGDNEKDVQAAFNANIPIRVLITDKEIKETKATSVFCTVSDVEDLLI